MYVRGEDRLLTLTGQEAVKLGMATALPAVKKTFAKLGAEETVTDLTPRFTEYGVVLATFAPVLAGPLSFLLFERRRRVLAYGRCWQRSAAPVSCCRSITWTWPRTSRSS